MATRLAAALLVVSTGCFANVMASGKSAHQRREVAPFTAVEVGGGIQATLVVGPQAPLEVDADDNVLPLVETVVEDGTLKIRFAHHSGFLSSGDVEVKVTAPSLHSVGASGGSHVRGEVAQTESLELEASGGAELSIRGLQVRELLAGGSGGSHLELSGRAEELKLEMSGGTKVRAGKLLVRTARVNGSGGATAEVLASDVLKGHLSGGSDVTLHGQAVSRVATSGGAEVHFDD